MILEVQCTGTYRVSAEIALHANGKVGCDMDLNTNQAGMPVEGGPYLGGVYQDFPIGFGMGLAMNESALVGFAGLTEAEKEEIIFRCRDVKTKDEMQTIIDSLVPGIDAQQVYEEERENFL